jgi:hypothetical protein
VEWIQLAQDEGTVADFLEYDNKPSGSVKGEELLDQLRDYQRLQTNLLSMELGNYNKQ